MGRNIKKIFFDTISNKKGHTLGFLDIEPEDLKPQYVPPKIQKVKTKVVYQRRKLQTEVFLSRYDFAYVGRDVVNQVAKNAPRVIRGATNDINNIAKQRIEQIISHGGKEVERVLLKILGGAIENVY